MPNIIINAVKLTGTYKDLEGARAELLQPMGDTLGLSCARAPIFASKETPVSDFKNAVLAARWTTMGQNEAVLSYLTAWMPSHVINDAVSNIASLHGAEVSDHIAITEVILSETPEFWRNTWPSKLTKADSDLFMLTGFFNVSPHYKQIVDAGLDRLARSAA